MNKTEILLQLVEYYANGNKRKFGQMLGLADGTVSAWCKRNTFDVDLVSTKCQDVSLRFLMTGEGPMLTTQQVEEESNTDSSAELRMLINELRALSGVIQSQINDSIEITKKAQQQFDRVLQAYEHQNGYHYVASRAAEEHSNMYNVKTDEI